MGLLSCRNGDDQKRTGVLLLAFVASFGFAVLMPIFAFGQNVKAQISTSTDGVNLQFTGRESWNYDLKRSENEIILRVPGIDEASLVTLQTFKSPFIQKITVVPGVDQKSEIHFKVTDSAIQSFDYLTDQPSRLIVDFFKNEDDQKAKKTTGRTTGKTTDKKTKASEVAKKMVPAGAKEEGVVAASNDEGKMRPAGTPNVDEAPQTQAAQVTQTQEPMALPKKLKTAARGKKSSTRAPASFESNAKSITDDTTHRSIGLSDAGDPDLKRFDIKDYEIRSSALLASQRNIYVPFPALKLPQPNLGPMLAAPPLYEIKPEDSVENKEARLLLTLFEKKRHALLLKTIELFRKHFPTSKYDEIIGYLEADTYYEMWRKDHEPEDFDRAVGLYNKMVSNYPESSLNERTQLLIGYSYLERGQSLNVIKTFEGFLRSHPTSPLRFQARIAIAEAYVSLRRFDDAREIFTQIENDPASGASGVEAAYRRGDIYFGESQLDLAIREYQRGQEKYPQEWKNFPNAFFNKAEALFWKKNFKESLSAFREFLQRFPSSDHGGYAMTRIGEILEILGADETRVAGAFLESVFRYRASPGANFARIRLVSSRMSTMKPKEIDKAVEEIREFQKTSDLPRLEDFITLMLSDGYFRRGELDRSLNLLTTFFQSNPTSNNLEVFKQRIVSNLAEQIKIATDNGDYMKAFEIYGKYAGNWLKNNNRMDLRYSLARSFEKAGVPVEAAQGYEEVLKNIGEKTHLPAAKERMVFESLPDPDTVKLRLAAVYAFDGKHAIAEQQIKSIVSSEKLSSEEHVELVELNAQIAESKGDLVGAKKYLREMLSTWTGQPSLVAPTYLRLCDLQIKSKELTQAEETILKISELMENGTGAESESGPDSDAHAKVLEKKAHLYVLLNQKDKAIEAFKDLLTRYEDKKPLASVRYSLGKLQFEMGNMKEAQNSWASLNKPESQFWYKLAQEQVNDSTWKDDYKKYLNRIPAMAPTAAPVPTPGAPQKEKTRQ